MTSTLDTTLPVIGITMGDPTGIGPEIIVKALTSDDTLGLCRPVVFGDPEILQREINALGLRTELRASESIDSGDFNPGEISVIPVSRLSPSSAAYGQPTRETGKAMAAYIRRAVEAASRHQIHAVVTAPINKKALHQAGFSYPGHTEMLAELTGARDVVMMLAGEKLRVVLVTIHCALTQIPELLDTNKILRTITIAHAGLSRLPGLSSPRIAVAGLNPHAGESGLFGREEKEIIAPAVEKARRQGLDVSGPFPPDTLFYHAARGRYDAVVCMYHDQGLIPLKLLHFDTAVNVTLGLPIVRTSVDHGTAYDIAGKGLASPASMVSAVRMAVQMARSAEG